MTQTKVNYASFLKTIEVASPGGEVYSSTDTVSKDKVLSVRIEPGLYSLLEALTEQWRTGSVSATVRNLLSMYFLPVVYELEWKNISPERVGEFRKQEQEQGYSMNLARLHKFLSELSEYMSFLVEAEEKGALSLGFIADKKEQVLSIIQNLAEAELKAGELLE
jgi:hypothetical protein